jgi:nucleoside-diphosphate-sugar epimerase
MKSKKIALIGGAGFIGHNLAISLKKRGHEPIIIDSLAVNNMLSFTDNEIKNRKLYWSILNQRMELIHDNNIDINIEDARNYNAMSMLLGKYKPDTIIQLAAVSHANKSNKDPHTTFDHTLRTLENTLDIAKGFGSHVIYFSSSMAYGHFDGKSVNEETPCNPLGIYGTLKYSGELIVKAYHRVFDIPYTIIRPSALYGERCVSRRVSQIFIENAVQGLDITINGDGSDKLDFTYIDDLIQGVTLTIENKKARNETFNMTYGEARTIGEMAEILKDHFEGININYLPKDKLTPDRGTLNVDKARNLLGYEPQNSIDDGYPKYIQWYKEFWEGLKK